MQKTLKLIPLFILGLFFSSNIAGAFVFGSSNLGMFGYPDHTCTKPFKPYSFDSQYEVDNYNLEVQMYVDCINDYVEAARNDIDRIVEKANQAVSEARY